MSQSASKLRWFALVVPPQKEYLAANVLSRYFGAETFVPTETRWRRRNRHCKAKEEIAFSVAPRYVFAGFYGVPPWLFIRQAPLITGYVGIDGTPLRLNGDRMQEFFGVASDGRIAMTNGKPEIHVAGRALRAAAEEKWMTTHHEFSVGQTVEITDGPFEGHVVEVSSIKGPMATVLLTLFNDQLKVPIETFKLAA